MSDEEMEIKENFIVSIAKAKANLEVDPTQFSDETYRYIFAEGLKAVLNARMSGIVGLTKMSAKELEKAHASALNKAKENLNDLYAGNIKHSRAKSKSSIPTIVRAEAMRLAKAAIKDAVRDAGLKPSHFADKMYTAKAKEYIETDPSYLSQAKANIEARKAGPTLTNFNIADLGPAVTPKLKTKATVLPAGIIDKPTVHAVHKGMN